MFGKNPGMNTLQSRKQLLLAESELNRAQLMRDLGDFKEGVGALAGRAKTAASIASSVGVFVSALAALRRSRRAEAGGKHTWLRMILKGARLVFTLWPAIRSAGREEKEK